MPLAIPASRAARAERGSFAACRRATSLAAACDGLADDLLADGYDLPSVYLLNGGRLRCRAARGYFQVVDGFPAGVGVIGRVVATGTGELVADVGDSPEFIAAVPGLRSEACVPVVVSGRVVGAVNVESRQTLPESVMAVLEEGARVLAERIESFGGLPAPSAAHQLGQVAVAMTQASSAEEIERLAVRAAAEVSGIRSAAIVHLRARGSVVTASCGPLGERLKRWDAGELATMAEWVSAGTSSHFPGGLDVPPAYAFLAAARVRALSVHPLVVAGRLRGLLVLASEDPVAYSAEMVELLEILAAQTSAALGVATAMAELARRAEQDGLTGLRNAAAFCTDLDNPIPGDDATLVLVDVDDFKAVNDSFGHVAGDKLLQALAAELSAVLREDDRLYRIGGDEFAALVSARSQAEVEALTTRMLEAARRCRTTVSIGTAPLDPDSERTRLYADAALYRAKAAGRDTARHTHTG